MPIGPNTNYVLANCLAARLRYTPQSFGYLFTDHNLTIEGQCAGARS